MTTGRERARWTTLRRAAALTAGALLATVLTAPDATSPAGAAPVQDVPGGIDVEPGDPPGDRIHPVLDVVAIDPTPETRRAEDTLLGAQRAEAAAADAFVTAERARAEAVARVAAAGSAVAAATDALARAEQVVALEQGELDRRQATVDRRRRAYENDQDLLRRLVAAVFTSTPGDELVGFGTFEQMSEGSRRGAVRETITDQQAAIVDARLEELEAATEERDAQRTVVADAEDARDEQAAELARARQARDDADRVRADAEAVADGRRRDLETAGDERQAAIVARRTARMTARVSGTDLTLVGLHAYWRSSALAPCPVPWWLLGGIGRVESRHGTMFGSSLAADGATTQRIIGIALDGRPGVAAIPDTDGGRLDGDRVWDRAVGPMQFIPGTWARWGRDGTGDGEADPHNIYDAATAAAHYLCFGRAEVTSDGSQRAALLSYNRSVPYGNQVLGHGDTYRRTLDLADLGDPGTEPERLPGVGE